ncbi:hypothetical protein HELRODRAFT_171146 [Helobdella robusta]|uniref:Sushi domain-containing protein n=1 Tax=Helobdella robusta TaxID=6412 RepID=T1F3V0_HELRO|nr:hypothetical protein HELRODRAFT_171146 [Helobdella robusta]ESO05508.1 hypothetical protein HELRODRAFT_171146 [Helobdella robusta]
MLIFEDGQNTAQEKLCRASRKYVIYTSATSSVVVYVKQQPQQPQQKQQQQQQQVDYFNPTAEIAKLKRKLIGHDSDMSPIVLLQYQAIGCPTLAPPPGATVTYTNENTASIKCNKTEETWSLSCERNVWSGDIANCTDVPEFSDPMGRDANPFVSSFTYFPYSLATAVTIGVLLGIVVGSVPLGLAYAFLKRLQIILLFIEKLIFKMKKN